MDVVTRSIMMRESAAAAYEDAFKDIQSLFMLGSGFGSLLGAVTAAVTTEYLNAHYAYGVAAASSLFLTCIACRYNERTGKIGDDVDQEKLMVEEEEKPSCARSFCTIWKNIFLVLRQGVVFKFFVFLLLIGIIMPKFEEHLYYFALDILKMSKFTVAILNITQGILLIIFPMFYQAYISNSTMRMIFFYNQIGYLFTASINYVMALQVNEDIGIPSFVLYALIGQTEMLETELLFMPTFQIASIVTPKGIEGTFIAFTSTIINLSFATLRKVSGWIVNEHITGNVTKDNIK